MSTGICVDCDKNVEIDEQGKCMECGSESTMKPQFNRLLNATPEGVVDLEDIIDKANILLRILREHPAFEKSKDTAPCLLLAHIRLVRLGGMSLGNFLENVIGLWAAEGQIEELESSEKKTN